MLFNLLNSKRAHFTISTLCTCLIGYFLSQVLLAQHYFDKQLYHDAEIRFVNTRGIRISDYLLKQDDQQFIVAPNTPNELKAHLELTDAGRYLAEIEADYLRKYCNSGEINQAKLRIKGGSLNEEVKLTKSSSPQLEFIAAKGQHLNLEVTNPINKDCGRAKVTLYQIHNLTVLEVGLLLIWFCVFVLCLFSRSSPYIVTLGLLTNTLLIAAQITLGDLTTASILVNSGIALGFAGLLFWASSIPFKSRLIALTTLLFSTLLLSPALAFITYETAFSVPMSIEAVHGVMQSYGSQALEFWKEFVSLKQTLTLIFIIFLFYLCFRELNHGRAKTSRALIFGLLGVLKIKNDINVLASVTGAKRDHSSGNIFEYIP